MPVESLLIYETTSGAGDDPAEILYRRKFLAQAKFDFPKIKWNAESELNALLEPVGPKKFFGAYFAKKPLHLKAASKISKKRFLSIYSFKRMLDEIRSRSISSANIRVMNRESLEIPKSTYTQGRDESRLAPPRLLKILNHQGGSVVLNHLHQTNFEVASLATRFENWIYAPVGINAYWTPAESQTFRWHWDTHDVMVLQVEGKKRWKLYDQVMPFPIHNDPEHNYKKWSEAQSERKPPHSVVILEAGDILYIPGGTPHDVSTLSDQSSMHLTIGINPGYWGEVVKVACDEAIEELRRNFEFLKRREPEVLSDRRLLADKLQRFSRALNLNPSQINEVFAQFANSKKPQPRR